MKTLYNKAVLWLLGTVITGMVALNSFMTRGRMSHENGIVARGRIKIVEKPEFPAHDFFLPGREFPCRIRHASIGASAAEMDDAHLDARSISIKFADAPVDSPFDIEMNNGPYPPFVTAREFWDFMIATIKGHGEAYVPVIAKNPHVETSAQKAFNRNPGSFTRLMYQSQLPLRFRAKDGKRRYVKFRVIPEDRNPEPHQLSDYEREHIWEQGTLPGETRSRNYLKQEFAERVKQGGVSYWLQMQLHEWQGNPEMLNPTTAWDDPWLDVATIEVDEVLPYEEGNWTVFSVTHHPPSIDLLPANSIYDYGSVNYLRSRTFFAKKMRLRSYKRGMPAPIPDER